MQNRMGKLNNLVKNINKEHKDLQNETLLIKQNGCYHYHKDRLNNLVFLSPSLCTKWAILFGRGKSTYAVYKQRQAKIWRQRSSMK
jgi:hypothetical protein